MPTSAHGVERQHLDADQLDLALPAAVDAALDDEHAVLDEQLARGAVGLVKMVTSVEPVRSSRARRTPSGRPSSSHVRAHETMPPTSRRSPSFRPGELGEPQSTLRRSWSRTSASGWLVRYSPSVSFSSASSSRRSNSISRMAGMARRRPGRTGSPRSKIEPCPASPSACDLLARAIAARPPQIAPLARRAGGVEAAALDQALEHALVEHLRMSTRSHMSQTDVNGPSPLARRRRSRGPRSPPRP